MKRFALVPLFLLCVWWTGPMLAQGFPQPSPNAKALFPDPFHVASIEAARRK